MLLFTSTTNLLSEDEGGAIEVPVTFRSDGSLIQGLFFTAKATEPSPTAILLQGFPGGEGDVFGLGHALSSAGINVFTFNWQGTWKSEGIILPEYSLRDVINALSFLKTAEMIQKFKIDTIQISIIGYSYGGGFAVLGSLHDPNVKKVATIAGGDLSVIANMIEQSEDFRKAHQAMMDECMSDPVVARGLGGKATHEIMIEHRDEYNLIKHAKELSEKDILMIGGWKDQAIRIEDHILPLYRALQENNARKVKIRIFDCTHSFTEVRDELGDTIIAWLKTEEQSPLKEP